MNNQRWKYTSKGEYPKLSDGLVFCKMKNGQYKSMLCSFLIETQKYFFYNENFGYSTDEVECWLYF